MSYDPATQPPPKATVELTAADIQVLTCAMAGNFPASLGYARMSALRKLARAAHSLGAVGMAGEQR